MDITQENIELAFRGFKKTFENAFGDVKSHRDTLAMTVNSTTSEENYAWMGEFPEMREWLGVRVIKTLQNHGFKIVNKDFESTVRVKRNSFEDDNLGVYTPMVKEIARMSKQHPDKMLFNLLSDGIAKNCYDGRPFFSEYHPRSGQVGDEAEPISNLQPGAQPMWYLMDLSRQIRPLVWQERKPYNFGALTDEKNEHVYMANEFLFGVHARVNAGFGLWQLAYASGAELNAANYEMARQAMMRFRGDQNHLLGIMPTHLVVPAELEGQARQLITASVIANNSNIWQGTAELIVTPWLS
ncbi:Mu-like prophage major head subunit gpT family protein [Fulvimarina sp. MAC3]|uniref:Mu-like prophage major head subunit gpT family protein n=1 Tax=Fulvimarina sp. MAC3 TaxID=3148887 RepID=UPI0031FC2D78